ncbi:unnamed protein product [Rhizoctonia solani]|uniref:Uncharacterized protein n=1 Tax=Rhizoctonia solani TaxID=456999 RepID=A0A8H2XM03_9AGAM|nr:unnamed protein product [Rhizoctonia solani]
MSLFNNFVQIFGRGSNTQVVDNRQATQLLKNVDDMLEESCKMLSGIKARVPAPEFESMELRHNQLYLMVVDVKSDIRGRQGNQVCFANAAERDEFYIQVRQLLTRCQIHHNDVLTISRRAYQRNLQLQAADSPSPTSSTPISTTKEDGSQTEWLSIVSESASGIHTPSPLSAGKLTTHTNHRPFRERNRPRINVAIGFGIIWKLYIFVSFALTSRPANLVFAAQQFIATVAHIPRRALATEEELQAQLPDDDSYYRILICGNKRKRAVVVDTKPHFISASYNDSDAERSQDEILRVGDMLMQSDPQKLEGHQVVQGYRGPSFISSFISSWHYDSLPLGGMV